MPVNCDNSGLVDVVSLLMSCFYVNDNGEVYLRYKHVGTSCNDPQAVNCTNNGTITLDELIKKSIVLDGCDKPCLVLGID